ncbi:MULTISPECIES: selenium cofactor biosynthesis protein YqeC [Halolamina]|uniref:Probable selenium-dependent hydroxylase accessory protein YqeC n=1 Tax=Halolamina pelagica TaxID=699431 RepID=A0A1I5V3Z2_9EURY|nr:MULTISPECIES: selenium cofactor biosynthesis protein YqeC [Halolamina]NHX37886.1 putative selenium-dependent hydroxylase accessory protein YqeC [Halolamina sp. R1-12]SFQ02239.1 probable selenium-dependent hydroxylase accessory protein YqeC [Halolamina pelagica]
MTDLAAALDADGMTCFVGAGGKKTTMYALAAETDRAVVTATVRIPIFDPHVARVVVTEDPISTLVTTDEFPLGLVPEREFEDRYRGYEPDTVTEIAAAHDGPTLVKADGARMRDFKAPGENEPRIPETADTVVPIASAHVVGEPLDEELVHRPERVAVVAGVDVGDEITPEIVGRVLASPDGGLRGVPAGATAIPLVNKVDDEDDLDAAREIADAVLDHADRSVVPRVVLARMADAEVREIRE